MNREREKEALVELIESEGWAVFSRLLHERFTGDAIKNSLMREMGTSDPATFGMLAAAIVAAADTVDHALQLPLAHIEYLDHLEEDNDSTGA